MSARRRPAAVFVWLFVAACAAPTPPPTPPRDIDREGVFLRIVDRCPDLPEDPDGFEDDDGCPDRDNDGDGILDAHSWDGRAWINCDGRAGISGEPVTDCRDRPETVNGREDDDGCPEVFTTDCADHHIDLLYDPETLALEGEAPALLEEFIAFIAQRPDIRAFIDGHAPPQRRPGASAALSRRAAERLQAELVGRGGPRLETRSFGDRVPIAENDTAEGRRRNTRVGVTWFDCGSGGAPLCGDGPALWRSRRGPGARLDPRGGTLAGDELR